MSLRAAGIEAFGDDVALLELPEPPALEAGEVLIDVKAAGVGNWEEFVRTGGWDVGRVPPLALGVEAAGEVVEVGPGGRMARRRHPRDDASAPPALPRLLGRAAGRPSTPRRR